MIGTRLDGNIDTLARDRLLVWMPAHQPLAAIGTRQLSNGKLLTAVDWRSNRLVDALAKQAAATREVPMAAALLLKSAQTAVRHASALLGRVTVAANHHEVSTPQEDGTERKVVQRDAQQLDGATRARRSRKRAARNARGHLEFHLHEVQVPRFIAWCACSATPSPHPTPTPTGAWAWCC